MIMVQLSDLYNADQYVRDIEVQDLRADVSIPHPLHGVDYADGTILCGRAGCLPCMEWRDRNYYCPKCAYEGRLPCPDCFGEGVIPPDTDMDCLFCEGLGAVTCDECYGLSWNPR